MEAAMKSFLCDATHVVRVARTLEAVDDDEDRHILALSGLPVAMTEQLRFRVDLEQPSFRRRNVKAPWHKGRHDGHCVSVGQQRMRFKWCTVDSHSENCIAHTSCKQVKASSLWRSSCLSDRHVFHALVLAQTECWAKDQ